MQHNKSWSEDGCFVYHITCTDGCGVRSKPSTSDEYRAGVAYEFGDLVAVSEILRSTDNKINSNNGPYLRLSNREGWLFANKNGQEMMRPVPVQSGLWSFYVDNIPVGQALRKNPIDRQNQILLKDGSSQEPISYSPMTKIYCDQKVTHPKTAVNYYRVQGTDGWVFDIRPRQGSNGNAIMMVEESTVMSGSFAYRTLSGNNSIAIRTNASVGDENRTDLSVQQGQIIEADIVRESPYPDSTNGPFLRLSDGSGWLFEKKFGERLMEQVPIQKGDWTIEILNLPHGLAARAQPIDEPRFKLPDQMYAPYTKLKCDMKIESPDTSTNFYHLKKLGGWVFDNRNGVQTARVIATRQTDEYDPYNFNAPNDNDDSNNNNVSNPPWTFGFVRGIALAVGLDEVHSDEENQLISLQTKEKDDNLCLQINIYCKSNTIGISSYAQTFTQGKIQTFQRDCTNENLLEIMKDPYNFARLCRSSNVLSRNDGNPVDTSLLLVEDEEEIRNQIIENNIQISKLKSQNETLSTLAKRYDDIREGQSNKMKAAAEARAAEARRKEENQRRIQREQQERERQERTCHRCNREFVNRHALNQHFNDVHQFPCYCGRYFISRHALNQHQNATGHW